MGTKNAANMQFEARTFDKRRKNERLREEIKEEIKQNKKDREEEQWMRSGNFLAR